MTDRPEMTPHPWPEAVSPRTEEFLPWFIEQSSEAQLWILDNIRDNADRGHRCLLFNHEDEIRHLRQWQANALVSREVNPIIEKAFGAAGGPRD